MLWIKHDTNASQDAKLKKVRMKYGLEGYGLYWYCIELIAADVDQNNLTFELEHDAEIISFDTGIHVERVNEMMAYMVDLGLFESSGDAITCLKLLKRLDQSMTSNKQMRELIVKAKENHDVVMIKSDSVMQEEKRLEENKDTQTQSHKDDKLTCLLTNITEHWNEHMSNYSPKIMLTDKTQVNKKRLSKIKRILADNKNYWDHEFWDGHIYNLATMPDFQWQRDNKQLMFDQAIQLDKFQRNLDLMKMGKL